MGGLGSGVWTRYGARQTLGSLRRIEITYLKKVGVLNSPVSGTLSWIRNGEDNGFIGYKSHSTYIELNFNFRRGDREEWQSVKQHINFDTTACNFGGVRHWFLCPNCYQRVGIICQADKLFLCRHCYKTVYSSQNESELDRLNSKKDKIAKRIFEDYKDGRGWLKKKGMHQKTFDKLYKEYRQLDYQSMMEYEGMLDRLKGLF